MWVKVLSLVFAVILTAWVVTTLAERVWGYAAFIFHWGERAIR